MESEDSGQTTRQALHKLYLEIEQCLHQFKAAQKQRKNKSWIKDTLHHSSQHTTINWISSSFQFWASISLIVAFIGLQKWELLAEAIVILLLLFANLSMELYDNHLRHNEIPNRARSFLEKLKRETDNIKWETDNYPNIRSPISPCITLQWTYRDGKLVNLPWSLLVKDDVIVIRPGQVCPGYCEALDKNPEYPLLHAKEVYAPSLSNANEIFSAPKSRKPLESKKYRLLETPYLNSLRIFLEQGLDRPVTQLNQQRHLIMIKTVERICLPGIYILILLLNLFRYFYYQETVGLFEMFFVVPVTSILPLLPLVFPVAWNLLNYLGMAKFKASFDATKSMESSSENCLEMEEDQDDDYVEQAEIRCNYGEVWRNFVSVLQGRPEILLRSANMVHVLGSVTALGCVDKKGILSWPNPTAEKVFFLHNNKNVSASSSLNNVGDLITDADESTGSTPHHFNYDSPGAATAEVLDLTHNHSEPFKMHFDDHDWNKHITSLKPLGLAILLNTCNIDTQEHYAAFCSHITCEAIYNENLVPVTNRRCLCELAKEIGFSEQAQKIFALEEQLSTYRHLQPEMVRRDNKYARSLHMSTKLKFPFPHMFAVVVRELSTGAMQLLSEGTADIILDSCVDYWDGHDLCPFSPSDRKRVQDFYQRSSLTAYCTAFAYRPLNKSVCSKLSEVYLELPSDSRQLYLNNHRSPTPIHWDVKSVLEPKIKTTLGQFYSTDSLLYNECPPADVSDADSCFQMQCNQVFIGMVTMQYQAFSDMVQLIEQLERACIRFVHFSKENELRSRVFSEKMGLESGWNCHISLLSERNRHSGQMESDNDTITNRTSLRDGKQRRLSQSARKLTVPHCEDFEKSSCLQFDSNLESSRTMSFSAPSAINMEHSVVKFDTEQEHLKNVSDQSGVYAKLASRDNVHSNDNNINSSHDWQSLSCLTDSTEQSAPINFDMSNRAKLPRGIDKIRPHIEFIDNVPLLVSLFTDCTPSATKEMLRIMQDYGEVVCIMGSSANYENAGIFMQADASVAVDPLYPQMCQKMHVWKRPVDCPAPTDLSRELNSMACSLCLKREDPISFYHLVMESRHFCTTLWNSVQFWLSCCVILSLMQFLAALLILPGLFTTGQVLWLSCAVVPLLSVSLMGLPVEPEVMKKPQGKNQVGMNTDLAVFILWCYGLKFLPVLLISLVFYVGILATHCGQLCAIKNCTCVWFYSPSFGGSTGWPEASWTLLSARLIVVFIVVLHFATISIGFVHRDYLIHQKPPLKNYLWLVTVFVIIVIQSIYTILMYDSLKAEFNKEYIYSIPTWASISAGTSPFITLLITELIKQREITVNQRFQKRARLDFGTKLGMNSPF